jgi:hypothetical protein
MLPDESEWLEGCLVSSAKCPTACLHSLSISSLSTLYIGDTALTGSIPQEVNSIMSTGHSANSVPFLFSQFRYFFFASTGV